MKLAAIFTVAIALLILGTALAFVWLLRLKI